MFRLDKTDALLISEKITEWRFGALLGVSGKFRSRLDVQAIWFNSVY